MQDQATNAASKDFVISRVLEGAARSGVAMLHRSRAYEAMVGSQGRQGRSPIWTCASAAPTSTAWRRRTEGMWGKFVYREVVPHEKLVFINSFSDENGGITRHPMEPNWPLEMLSTFSFEDVPGGKTKFTVTWTPHNASEEEHKTFDSNRQTMLRRLEWHHGPAREPTWRARSNSKEFGMQISAKKLQHVFASTRKPKRQRTSMCRSLRIPGSATSAAIRRMWHGKKAGSVMVVEFDINGQPFTALNGPQFKFTRLCRFRWPAIPRKKSTTSGAS